MVTVKNDAAALPLTLTSLVDAPFGDITQVQGAVTATTCVPDQDPATCQVGGEIAPGGSCSCTFTATVPPGDFPGSFTDVVTGCGTNLLNPTPVCDDDDAEVPYTDVVQPPTLTKTRVSSMPDRCDLQRRREQRLRAGYLDAEHAERRLRTATSPRSTATSSARPARCRRRSRRLATTPVRLWEGSPVVTRRWRTR